MDQLTNALSLGNELGLFRANYADEIAQLTAEIAALTQTQTILTGLRNTAKDEMTDDVPGGYTTAFFDIALDALALQTRTKITKRYQLIGELQTRISAVYTDLNELVLSLEGPLIQAKKSRRT